MEYTCMSKKLIHDRERQLTGIISSVSISVDVSSVCWLLSALPESAQFSTWPFPKGKAAVVTPLWYISCCPVSMHPRTLVPISADPTFYTNTTFKTQKFQSHKTLTKQNSSTMFLQQWKRVRRRKTTVLNVFNVPYCMLLPPTTLFDLTLNIEPAKEYKIEIIHTITNTHTQTMHVM